MEDLFNLAEKVVSKAKENGFKLACAESCTGGMVAAAITSVSGSSEVFDRGFVTYSNLSKQELLGVSNNTLNNFGAVSQECVEEMAIGAVKNSSAQIAVSVSGIAGPSGGTEEKPVGTVVFGAFNKNNNKMKIEAKNFTGDRNSVRNQATKRSLELFLVMMDN